MRLLLLTLLISLGFPASGQQIIKGKVTTEQGTPIAYATVAVQPAVGDSALLGVGYTDSLGSFSLSLAGTKRLRVTASYLGYETVTATGLPTDFFTLILGETATTLAGVEVSAQRLSVYALQGGLALDVAGNASLAGSTGLEVLELLPAVNLVGESGVSIRGNTNVRLFINGRETNRKMASLRNFSAERIERVELYTSPPARFDAGGSGGIINIVLRKSQRVGRQLTLDGQLIAPGRMGGGVRGELNGEKWLFSGGLRLGYTDFRNSFTSLTELPGQQLQLSSRTQGIQHTPEGNFSLQFRPDTTLSLQLEGNYEGWYLRGQERKTFAERMVSGTTTETEDEGALSCALDWQVGDGHNIGLSLRASGEQEETGSQSDAQIEDLIPSKTQTDETQLLRQLQLDYTLAPLGLKLLRFGTKHDLVDFDTRQLVTLEATTMTTFTADLRKEGYYVEVEKDWDNWSLYGGLRYEAYTASVKAENTLGQNGYQGFFPSTTLTYETTTDEGSNSWQINYSRRLDRPGFFDLVPLITYNSPIAQETGNPFLLPEINDRLELTQRRNTNRLSLSWTAFYDRKYNIIQTTISQPTPGTLLLRPENLGRQISWGFEGSVELNGSWWSSQLTGNIYRANFREDEVKGGGARLRVRQEFSLPRSWTIQVIGQYLANSRSLRQRDLGYATADIVLSKRFGQDGGAITLRAQDIFDQRVFQYQVIQDGLAENHTYKWQTRRISLNLRIPLFNR